MSEAMMYSKPTRAEPDLLHTLLGHYARQLWDVQQIRIALGNRVGAMEREGLGEEWRAPSEHILGEVRKLEAAVDKRLVSLMKRHPLREWVEQAPGLGLPGAARLLGATGTLDRFATVGKLWAYLGLHVVDGVAPRKRRGHRANWSQQGRKTCYVIADCIVKSGGDGRYRKAYDTKKAEYLARERTGPSECPFGQTHNGKNGGAPIKCGAAHPHAAAMRYAVKTLLRDMWLEWRRLTAENEAPASDLHESHTNLAGVS